MLFVLIGVLLAVCFHSYLSYSKSSSSNDNQEFLKPDIKTFLFYGFIRSFFLITVLLVAIHIALSLVMVYFETSMSGGTATGLSTKYLWSLLSLSALFLYISLVVKYKKEKYYFYDDKLIHKGGGLLSDFTIELNIKNITHVTMMLPFIEHNLFGAGFIKIESAGALKAEIYLRAIVNTEEIYENIIKTMQNNGFQLKREELVAKERPHPLAVFFEVFAGFFGSLAFMAYVLFPEKGESRASIWKFVSEHSFLFIGGLGLVLFGLLIFFFFRFLDLRKRIYALYEDTITYSEGFLNKNYSFIPIENLTDSTVMQSIPSRIFGLYDVKVSCQGSGQEILFKNMGNGEAFSKNVTDLMSKINPIIKAEVQEVQEVIPAVKDDVPEVKAAIRKVELDREYTDEFRMEALRTWMPALLSLPLLIVIIPLGILAIIRNIIIISCNVFRVKADTIEHTFKFLAKKTKEFSIDKVTGIIIKENFMDKWCKTCSILFWSIGAGENIAFSNIKKTEQLREKILAKKGIIEQNALHTINSAYSFGNMIKANIYLYVIYACLLSVAFILSTSIGLLSLAILVVCNIISFIYRVIYYKRSKIVFYENHVHFKRGLFFVEEYFVHYDDIKDILTIKYPLSTKGSVKFNVAGELAVKTQYGAHIVSNSFTIRFVDNIKALDELLDAIFYRGASEKIINRFKNNMEDTSSKPEYSTKQCLSNHLIFVLPIVILIDVVTIMFAQWLSYGAALQGILVVMFAFSAIVLGPVIIVIKAVSYNIQPYRIYKRSGVIFKKQMSITFNKVDFINFSQGPINKIFNNGNITINTTGSSKPELTIKNIKDFKKFYEIVKGRYK